MDKIDEKHVNEQMKIIDEVRDLIRPGANINQRDIEGNTALHHVVMHANKLSHGYVVVTLTNKLIEHGADPRLTNHQGKSALDLVRNMEVRDVIEARVKELNLRDALEMSTSRQHEQARQGRGRRM